MKSITKTKVKKFVTDHKVELFLGSIFTTGIAVGYAFGYSKGTSLDSVIKHACRHFDKCGIGKDPKKPDVINIFMDNAKLGKGIQIDWDVEDVKEVLK